MADKKNYPIRELDLKDYTKWCKEFNVSSRYIKKHQDLLDRARDLNSQYNYTNYQFKTTP